MITKKEKCFRSSTRSLSLPLSCIFETFNPSSVTNAVLLGDRYYLALDSCWSSENRTGTATLTDGTVVKPILSSEIHYDVATSMYFYAQVGSTSSSFKDFVEPSFGDDVVLLPLRRKDSTIERYVLPGRVRGVSNAHNLSGRPGIGRLYTYTCETLPGDCGSLVISNRGFLGFHVGCDLVSKVNVFWAPPLLSSENHRRIVSAPRDTDRFKVEMRVGQESLVAMQPAPSDYLGHQSTNSNSLSEIVDAIVNPWSPFCIRIPDVVIAPTSTGKLYANRTYNITSTGSAGSAEATGPNILFGMHTKLSVYSTTVPASSSSNIGAGTFAPYNYTPGNILSPIQWGLNTYTDPYTAFAGLGGGSIPTGPWSDDFGSSLSSMIKYVTAFRTTSAGIRVRVIGLPSGQFMTPGKIYFAQVRYSNSDLPLTEQDFVILEQMGRAVHVSADAVREAGSKTIFYTPDAPEKFDMTSSFIIPPGILNNTDNSGGWVGNTTAGVRYFPKYNDVNFVPTSTMSNNSFSIIPYDTAATISTAKGIEDATDMGAADQTAVLLVAYFGAQDGVVLEVDYALNFEYIPNKSAPAGIEAKVQLPNALMLDSIYSAAAVLTEAKPYLIQSKGDKTVTSSSRLGPQVSKESLLVRERLTKMVASSRGRAYREGFWDFDWLKSGNIGGLSWDFRDKPAVAPAPQPKSPTVTKTKKKAKKLNRKLGM